MELHFTKMQGAGNDYIYVDCLKEQVADPTRLAIRLSNRHYGVGSDGLVLIMPSEKADYRMRIFNADGSEAQMCGNACRCVGRYLWEHGMLHGEGLRLETMAGIRQIDLKVREGKLEEVSVNMGSPRITEQAIGLRIGGKDVELTCVDMGNPHAVLFVNDIDSAEVHVLGPAIENHPHFPQRTNVEFVQIVDNERIRMRVWERGSGETLACGTGACAAAAVATATQQLSDHLTVELPGGVLHTVWERGSNEIVLTGGAERVFEGKIEI